MPIRKRIKSETEEGNSEGWWWTGAWFSTALSRMDRVNCASKTARGIPGCGTAWDQELARVSLPIVRNTTNPRWESSPFSGGTLSWQGTWKDSRQVGWFSRLRCPPELKGYLGREIEGWAENSGKRQWRLDKGLHRLIATMIIQPHQLINVRYRCYHIVHVIISCIQEGKDFQNYSIAGTPKSFSLKNYTRANKTQIMQHRLKLSFF